MKERVKIFTVTKLGEREMLSEQITRWLNQEPKKEVYRVDTLQSSDHEFHCLTLIYFYRTAE